MNTTNSKEANSATLSGQIRTKIDVKLIYFEEVKNSIISPSPQRSSKPRSPIIDAQYNDNMTRIIVYAVILIDAADTTFTTKTIKFYQAPPETGDDGSILQPMYVAYNYPENKPDAVKIYSIAFEIPAEVRSGIISEVELSLWDLDPTGSRGTKTTVKPPTQ